MTCAGKLSAKRKFTSLYFLSPKIAMVFEKSILLDNFSIGEFMTFISKASINEMPSSLLLAMKTCVEDSANSTFIRNGMDIESDNRPWEDNKQNPRKTRETIPTKSILEERQFKDYELKNAYEPPASLMNQPVVHTYSPTEDIYLSAKEIGRASCRERV